MYKVGICGSTQEHTVKAKGYEIKMVSYSFKLFEYLGILCDHHSLKILDVMNIKMMTQSKYILKRWTKDVTIANKINITEGNGENDPVLEVTKCYRLLCPIFVQLSVEASELGEGYDLTVDYAKKLSKTLKDAKEKARFEC
ncbi:hypothetical protein LguiA_022986 [Lonicera macranthoides]